MKSCDDGPCKVAIADDVPDIRRLMRFWLDSAAGEFLVVGEASNGLEAIDLVAAQHPDALILDISMPRLDGLQAIERIREESPDTKILVVSGFEEGVMSQQVLDLGADAYLEKGTSLKDIADVLRSLCAAA